jgi:hypothetical protein
MMRRILGVLCLLFIVAVFHLPLHAEDVNVSGVWKVTTQGPQGERVQDMTFLQEGEKLSVTSKDREGNDVTATGTVKGSEISWSMKRETPMGELVIAYKGKIEGKKMSGTRTFGEDRTSEWKAEKVEIQKDPTKAG